MNTIKLKHFSNAWWNIQVREIQRAFWTEKKPLGVERNMKGSIMEANIGGQGQGWLPISLYTLYWEFKKIPFTLYTYLDKILKNGAKFIQTTNSRSKKSYEEFGQLQTSSRKS